MFDPSYLDIADGKQVGFGPHVAESGGGGSTAVVTGRLQWANQHPPSHGTGPIGFLAGIANCGVSIEGEILFAWKVFYVTGYTPWMRDKDTITGEAT